MKIVIDKDIPFIKGLLEPYFNVVYIAGKDISHKDVTDANALIIRTRTNCNSSLLKNTAVKYIASATIGTDHIDAEWCNNNGIKWSNAAGCNSHAVVQYTLCSLLYLAQKNNITLKDKTIGIVGVGNIGSKIKKAAEVLGLKVLLNDPPRAEKERSNEFVSIECIAESADFITFHVPLTQATNLLANNVFFDSLKKKPYLINTSRGEVIDELVLTDAIINKKISGAVLDVWNNEPNINKNILKLVDIGTPHIAGYSVQGKANATTIAANNVAEFFNIPEKFIIDNAKPVNTVIEVDMENKSEQEIVKEILGSTYDIMLDDISLRNDYDKFEKLRSEYNYRFEPQSFSVCAGNMSKNLTFTLKVLGFNIIHK